MSKRRQVVSSFRWLMPVLVLLLLFALARVGIWDVRSKISTAEVLQILIMLTLVLITAEYAKVTSDIAEAAQKQAAASRDMARGMTDARFASAQPVVSLFGVHGDGFLFRVRVLNEGTGPALNVKLTARHPQLTLGDRIVTVMPVGGKPLDVTLRAERELDSVVGCVVEAEYESIYTKASGRSFKSRLEVDEHGQPHLRIEELHSREMEP